MLHTIDLLKFIETIEDYFEKDPLIIIKKTLVELQKQKFIKIYPFDPKRPLFSIDHNSEILLLRKLDQDSKSLLDSALNTEKLNITISGFNNKAKIFKLDSVFSLDYVPEELPHRTSQILEILKKFSQVIKQEDGRAYLTFKSQIVNLIGPPGTGKSITAKTFGEKFQEFLQKKFSAQEITIKYFHVNCKRNRTMHSILTLIFGFLKPKFQKRGNAPSALLRDLQDYLQIHRIYLIITLDEIEFLVANDKEKAMAILESIVRFNENSFIEIGEIKQQFVSLIIISSNLEFINNIVDSSSYLVLSRNVIQFPKYTEQQSIDILKERVDRGLYLGAISENTISLIANLSSTTNYGHAGLLIELLWRAGRLAEESDSRSISDNFVEMALNQNYHREKKAIRHLNRNQLLFLFLVANLYDAGYTSKDVQLFLIKKQIPKVNKRFKSKIGKSHQAVSEYIKRLEIDQLLERIKNGKNRIGVQHSFKLKVPPRLVIEQVKELISGN